MHAAVAPPALRDLVQSAAGRSGSGPGCNVAGGTESTALVFSAGRCRPHEFRRRSCGSASVLFWQGTGVSCFARRPPLRRCWPCHRSATRLHRVQGMKRLISTAGRSVLPPSPISANLLAAAISFTSLLLLRVDKHTLAALRNPSRRPPLAQMDRGLNRSQAPVVELSESRFLANARWAHKGAAPGPSVCTREHPRVLLDDEHCVELLCAPARQVASAQVPAAIVPAFCLGGVVALSKPTRGVRALIMGDAFCRAVATNHIVSNWSCPLGVRRMGRHKPSDSIASRQPRRKPGGSPWSHKRVSTPVQNYAFGELRPRSLQFCALQFSRVQKTSTARSLNNFFFPGPFCVRISGPSC